MANQTTYTPRKVINELTFACFAEYTLYKYTSCVFLSNGEQASPATLLIKTQVSKKKYPTTDCSDLAELDILEMTKASRN